MCAATETKKHRKNNIFTSKDDNHLKKLIRDNKKSDQLLILEFFRVDCLACQEFKHVFEKISISFPNHCFVFCKGLFHVKMKKMLNIVVVPTVAFVSKGKSIGVVKAPTKFFLLELLKSFDENDYAFRLEIKNITRLGSVIVELCIGEDDEKVEMKRDIADFALNEKRHIYCPGKFWKSLKGNI
jgi:thiol-disulfide isomerase/thioredoxin